MFWAAVDVVAAVDVGVVAVAVAQQEKEQGKQVKQEMEMATEMETVMEPSLEGIHFVPQAAAPVAVGINSFPV